MDVRQGCWRAAQPFSFTRRRRPPGSTPLLSATLPQPDNLRFASNPGEIQKQSRTVWQTSVERLALQVATIRSDFPQGHARGQTGRWISLRINLEVILGSRFVRWSVCQRLYIPSHYRKLTHHVSDKT